MTDQTSAGQSTLSIWGGEQEHELYERSTQVPVVHSVSFTYKDIDTWQDVALEKTPGHIYSRNTNPTVRAFEDKVKELESAEAATSFASGMAAISNVLGTFLKPGDRIVSIDQASIAGLSDIRLALWDKKPGDKVTVQIQRKRWLAGPETLTFEVELQQSQ